MTHHATQVADMAHLAALLVRGQHRAIDELDADLSASGIDEGESSDAADLDDGEPLSH